MFKIDKVSTRHAMYTEDEQQRFLLFTDELKLLLESVNQGKQWYADEDGDIITIGGQEIVFHLCEPNDLDTDLDAELAYDLEDFIRWAEKYLRSQPKEEEYCWDVNELKKPCTCTHSFLIKGCECGAVTPFDSNGLIYSKIGG